MANYPAMAAPPAGALLGLKHQAWKVRHGLHDAGFTPVDITSPWFDRRVPANAQPGRKKPGDPWVTEPGKAPFRKGWQGLWQNRAASPVLWDNPPSDILNTGILTRGLRVFDVDVDDGGQVQAICASITRLAGHAPVRTRPDSNHCALIYRAAEGQPGKRVIRGAGRMVEILGDGQQLLVHGTHPGGQRYRVDCPPGVPFKRDALPAITEEQVTAVMAQIGPLIGADRVPVALRGGRAASLDCVGEAAPVEALDALEDIIAATPCPSSMAYDPWFGTACAFVTAFAADPDSGREAWLEWCSRYEGTVDPAKDASAYADAALKSKRHAGVHTLLRLAQNYGIDTSGYERAVARANLATAQTEFEPLEALGGHQAASAATPPPRTRRPGTPVKAVTAPAAVAMSMTAEDREMFRAALQHIADTPDPGDVHRRLSDEMPPLARLAAGGRLDWGVMRRGLEEAVRRAGGSPEGIDIEINRARWRASRNSEVGV